MNPKLKVPTKNQVNKLVDLLIDNDIIAARVIYQDKKKRILEKLEGDFFRPFSFGQCIKAAKFLKKLHKVLEQAEPIGHFHFVRDFSNGDQMVWGDVNASNFLWRNDEVVGVVDYDSVMRGNIWVDVSMAIVNWQENFDFEQSKQIIAAYDISGNWVEYVQKYILLCHKQYADVSFGMNHIKKSRNYCLGRLKKLNKQYEKSIIWRSL